MSDTWYLVPTAGSGGARDPRHPKYSDRFDGYSSYLVEQHDRFIVRFFGDSSAHDQTQSEGDVESATPEEAAQRLNDALGTDYSPETWEAKLFA